MIILGLAVAIAIIFYATNRYLPNQNDSLSDNVTSAGNSEDINYNPPSNEEVQRAESDKVNNIEKPKTSDNNQSNEVKIQEIYQDSDTGQVIVKTELYGSDWDTCTLTLNFNNMSVVKTAQTIYQQPYYSCMGFAVDSSEFKQSGEWKATLFVSKTSGQELKSVESTINIQL